MVVVRGCEWEAARVKEATLLLMDHLCNAAGGGQQPPQQQQQQQQQMRGGSGGNNHQHQGEGGFGDVPVLMNMEISPQHHAIVLGKVREKNSISLSQCIFIPSIGPLQNNLTLKLIMQRTNTTILFPDASDPNIPTIRKGSVTIIGSIHNVYLARQQLIVSCYNLAH